jgi:hypothetical protein
MVSFSATVSSADTPPPTFKQYCFGCHGKAVAMAGINLQQLTAQPSVGENFQRWQRVTAALEDKRMPPAKVKQPSDADRLGAATWIRARLSEYIEKHAGDPGRVTVRRLTSGEYANTVHDLTGLELKLDGEFATDSVGGEGFTNYGDVQFMADANLERYLESAKKIADHAVIGAGPIGFFDDPGKSGFELSAISRIQEIYRANGFRSSSGEGGKPFGLDRYTKAFYVCWQYRYRNALGARNATLDSLAAREGVSARFAHHIWSVLHQKSPTYPISDVISRWRSMPAPTGTDRNKVMASARTGAEGVMKTVIDWPRWLFAAGGVAEGGQGDERSFALTDASLQASPSHHYKFIIRTRGKKTSRVYLSLVPVNANAKDTPAVIWRNASFRVRGKEKGFGPAQPLKELLDEATAARLAFGKGLDGAAIAPQDFAMRGDSTLYFDINTPDDAVGGELQADVELSSGESGDAVLRSTISDSEEPAKGRPVWALLGNSKSAGFQSWKAGVLEFAARLPQNSQGEPAPADKDPIPLPFDNTYNQPERDRFHTQLKYYRDDHFLVENVLDDATRKKLDYAWDDLLASFDYHDIFLRFVAEKYHLNLTSKRIAELGKAEIEGLPAEPRKYVQALRAEYDAVHGAQEKARAGHVEDCLQFAAKAWRRPLSAAENDSLRSFYVKSTEKDKLDHGKAIELLLARILVSPSFLYRLEQPAQQSGEKVLSQWELASRLSYFLWSSIPDDELRRAAAAGELSTTHNLEKQVKRMLADPKARRLSTEFFGQWLGFYHFDQHRGVDTKRFPEFTEEVKSAMYDEAISFFEHIVRKDRPVREIIEADYTFLNKPLAKHYGVDKNVESTTQTELVEGANAFHRGGLLRLGAVLTVTSAPLRTSPVKRGDWVLRRVLGTPTPPPPADAGSLPGDDKLFGELSVKQRLAAHMRNASCARCHTRIDPMGFPLEHFDSVGRWRESYTDGKPIDDTSVMTDQTKLAGIDGLLDYLKTQEPQVLRTMSHKLIGYALGRNVLASDQPLVESLVKAGADATFSQLTTAIVTSKQFRYRRDREDSTVPATTQQTSVTPAAKESTKEGGE